MEDLLFITKKYITPIIILVVMSAFCLLCFHLMKKSREITKKERKLLMKIISYARDLGPEKGAELIKRRLNTLMSLDLEIYQEKPFLVAGRLLKESRTNQPFEEILQNGYPEDVKKKFYRQIFKAVYRVR